MRMARKVLSMLSMDNANTTPGLTMKTALTTQLNAEPSLRKLGGAFLLVAHCNNADGSPRLGVEFQKGGYTHCVNADIRGFSEADYAYGVVMVRRVGGSKRYEAAPHNADGTVTAEGLAVILRHLKSGLRKYAKTLATASLTEAFEGKL